jgi:predicted DNA-binding transcriptional regulator AlpA
VLDVHNSSDPGASIASMYSLRLAGLAEVAELLGVTKRSASRYAKRGDVPKPIVRLAAGAIWTAGEVEAWAAEQPPLRPGRLGRISG